MKKTHSESNTLPSLLATSLLVPHIPAGLVGRPGLLEKMDQATDYPLTLITAPPGFGKTTLLSQWVAGLKNKNHFKRAAWVSVERECDLRRFWRYVVTALDRVEPGVGKSALVLLEPAQPPIHATLRALLNAITAVENDFVLVLDDYNQVDDPAVHAALTFFIDHLPPNLHLVIAGRNQPPLPLARWRAGRRLYELQEADIRFTKPEVTAFFNDVKNLGLLDAEMTALEAHTEGWIAGLQLVALSLNGADEAAKRSFISAFTGSQRYILDYLIGEVLQRQPEDVKSFLLRTSVLDSLSAPLCNAVTGQADGQEMLEYLERAHIFILALDYEQKVYRYHHLFRDVLYHQLTQTEPELVLELHRRAAEWFRRAGQTDDAIRHACAGQAWEQAIGLIEPNLRAAWNRGEVRKIIRWLNKLPADHLDARSDLALYYSRALLLGGQMDKADQRLHATERTLRTRPAATPEERRLLGAVCAFRTTIAAVSGDTAAAQALGQEALNLLPPANLDVRAHAINSLGVNDYYAGDMPAAEQKCAQANEIAQQVGNLYLTLVAATYQAKALICRGKLRQAEEILQHGLKLGQTPSLPIQAWIPAAGVICSRFGLLLYEWNRLEEAEFYLKEAIELGQRLVFGSALWYSYLALVRIRLAQGDRKGAESEFEQAQRYRLSYSVPLPERLMDAEQARAELALRRAEAVGLLAPAYDAARPQAPGYIHEFEGIMRARLHLFQGEAEQARALLDSLRPGAEANGRQGCVIEILALTALAQHAQGATAQALETLHTALKPAEPEGYLRLFVDEGQPMAALLYQALEQGIMPDYVNRLLAAIAADAPLAEAGLPKFAAPAATGAGAQIDPLIEPLSPRELEVLQLIAGGATNQEIAEQLTIAVTTAKKHVSNILQKLAADNRTEAAAKGRGLGLCE